MSVKTAIEWTDATFNPWWGCARVSPACQFCYAEAFAKRTGHDVWGKGGDRRFFGDKHWNEPLVWNRRAEEAGVPMRVFCASMADVFEDHPALPEHRERLWNLIEATPMLRWQLLTKRPEHVAAMAPWTTWPAHVWLGATVENQRYAEERIPHLLSIPAAVRFLSCEPLLGPVELSRWLGLEWMESFAGWGVEMFAAATGTWGQAGGIGWVIAGGESGGKARPMHPDWVRSLRDQCIAAEVPFLFKQWGEWGPRRETLTRPLQIRGDFYPTETETVEADVLKRLGKKAAGRTLDGRTWDEFPEPRP